jgi:hypothetical protein
MSEMIAKFPPAVKDTFARNDLSSAAEYLQSTTFGLVALLTMISYGIAARASAVDFAAQVLNAALLGVVLGGPALAVSAATGRRSIDAEPAR